MTYDKVLVTGGAGFIGSHTVDALLSQGTRVWVLDDLSTGYLRNLRTWKSNHRLHFVRNSTVRYKTVESLTRKVEAVIHLAAAVSPYLSIKRPEVVNEVNVSGTLNILRASAKNRIQRVVFASSSSVYGNQTVLPIAENNPIRPVTPYGASKVSGEKYCEAFAQTYGLSAICLRYFNVYGDRQSANPYSGVIAIFANQLSKGKRPSIFGDGEQTRDFIHVTDVATANLKALQTSSGTGEAFNIGTGRATTINQLFLALAEILSKPDVAPIHTNERQGDIRHSYADTTRTKETLNFQPKIEFAHGLKRLVDSISTNIS